MARARSVGELQRQLDSYPNICYCTYLLPPLQMGRHKTHHSIWGAQILDSLSKASKLNNNTKAVAFLWPKDSADWLSCNVSICLRFNTLFRNPRKYRNKVIDLSSVYSTTSFTYTIGLIIDIFQAFRRYPASKQ